MPPAPSKPITSAEFYDTLLDTDRVVATRTQLNQPDVNKRVGLLPPVALVDYLAPRLYRGGNGSGVPVKVVDFYDATEPGFDPLKHSALTTLDPVFLCLKTRCIIVNPRPNQPGEYTLEYNTFSAATMRVWRDGRFSQAGQQSDAQWYAVKSPEAAAPEWASLQAAPPVANYNFPVKYLLRHPFAGNQLFFETKVAGVLPAPSLADGDANYLRVAREAVAVPGVTPWQFVGDPANGNICIGPPKASNTYGAGAQGNTLHFGAAQVAFGADCGSNTVQAYGFTMQFGAGSNANEVGTFGNGITFGINCGSNTIGSNVRTLSFGTGCLYNRVDANARSITFGNACTDNVVGPSCQFVTFGAGCLRNEVYNTVGAAATPFLIPANTIGKVYRNGVEVMPSDTFAALTYAASIALDFNAATVQTLAATGNVALAASLNVALLKTKELYITNTTGAAITLSCPAGWSFFPGPAPTTLAAGKQAVLTLRAVGATDSTVKAAYVAQA